MVTVGRKELATLSCSRPFGCSLPCSLGFPGGSVVKNPPAVQEMQKMWVCSLGWEDALEKEVLPPPIFLPGKSHGQRSLAGYIVHGVIQSQTQLKQMSMHACIRCSLTFFFFLSG